MLNKFRQIFKSPDKIPENGSLPAAVVQEYYKSRIIAHKTHLCHAPFNNMYFNSLGDVANCWLTFEDPEHYTEEKTLKEIWFGEKFSRLREAIKKQDLDYRCGTCQHNLNTGNFINVLSRAYDNEYPLSDFPSMMEFELTNTCNLECTMCTGLLSSSIRSNRDKLPPLRSPYGAKFVSELKEFIPHLYEARFNGGEPFLIKMYAQIWDLIIDIKPEIKVVIATNGTVLNERVKDYMSRGNFHINLSIDGLSPETYNNIRINGDISKVLENFRWFRDFCHQHKRNLCVMINPMRQNWQEMPDFVNFCNENNVHLWFNTIMRPLDQAIWNLPYVQLKEIYDTLSGAELKTFYSGNRNIHSYNRSTYKNLVEQQIKTWMIEARERESSVVQSLSVPVDTIADFESKWANFLDTLEDEKERSFLRNKLDSLKDELSIEADEKTFYRIIGSAPFEILVSNLKEYEAENLKERFRIAVTTI